MAGFNQNFLGSSAANIVAIPSIKGVSVSNDNPLLHHEHFSVRFNTARRLAWFSAFNSGPPYWGGRTKAWHTDPDVPADKQADNSYYASNPWDRGHLVAVDFVDWGTDNIELDEF